MDFAKEWSYLFPDFHLAHAYYTIQTFSVWYILVQPSRYRSASAEIQSAIHLLPTIWISQEMEDNPKLIEFQALRDEILKQIELQQDTLNMTLTFAAAFLGAGLLQNSQTNLVGPSLAFIYPIIAALLALRWAQINYQLGNLGDYIKEKIEVPNSGLGWQSYLLNPGEGRSLIKWNGRGLPRAGISLISWKGHALSQGGIFICTQLMATLIVLASFTNTPFQWGLLGLDILSILFVIWLLIGFLGDITEGNKDTKNRVSSRIEKLKSKNKQGS
jgi:hypothetical protein